MTIRSRNRTMSQALIESFSPTVLLDSPHNGARREHDCRCERRQSIDRQLCHVCRRLRNAVAGLPHCRHHQRGLCHLAILHARSGCTQYFILPHRWYCACRLPQRPQLPQLCKHQAQRAMKQSESERRLTIDHRITSRPTRSLEDQITTRRGAKKLKR